MYRKNTASQFVCVQLLLTATGAVATGLSPIVRRCIDGTFAAGGGTVTEDSSGFYKYAMAQADTNGNDISLAFSAATAMPVVVNFVTTAADPTDGVRLGLTALPNAAASAIGGLPLSVDTSGRVDVLKINGTSQTARDIGASVITASGTVTTVTNQLTAAQIATGVWQDTTAGDFTVASSIGKSLFTSGNAPGAASGLALVGSNMGTITGALTAAQIATGIWQDATAGDFTTASSIGKSIYNAFGANTSVYTVAALANAPSGGLTGAQIATAVWTDTTAGDFTTALSIGKSIMNGVSLGTGLTINDLTTKTGFALSGTQTFNMTGSITGSLSGSVGSVTGNVGGNVVGSVASVTANVNADIKAVNGDTTSAASLAKTTRAIGRGTVSGSPSVTSIPTSAFAPAGAVADQFKGRIITFDADTTTAALRGQATDITANTSSATPTLTVTALTTSPAVGDTFSVT